MASAAAERAPKLMPMVLAAPGTPEGEPEPEGLVGWVGEAVLPGAVPLPLVGEAPPVAVGAAVILEKVVAPPLGRASVTQRMEPS